MANASATLLQVLQVVQVLEEVLQVVQQTGLCRCQRTIVEYTVFYHVEHCSVATSRVGTLTPLYCSFPTGLRMNKQRIVWRLKGQSAIYEGIHELDENVYGEI